MASFCLRNFHSLYTPNCKRPRFNRTRRSVNILASWYFFLFDFTCFKLLWVFQYSARLWAPSLVRPIQSPLSFKTSSSTNTFPLPLTLSIPGLSLVCSRWNPFFRHGTHWRDQRSTWLIIFLLLFCKSRGEHLWLIATSCYRCASQSRKRMKPSNEPSREEVLLTRNTLLWWNASILFLFYAVPDTNTVARFILQNF